MAEKMLPLLSDGLRKIIENIIEKHPSCNIAKELLLADDLIIGYNDLEGRVWTESDETPVMTVLREKIESLINNEARMLSFRYNTFEISYLPKGKVAIYSSPGVWGREGRQVAKPARIIQKMLIHEFKCKEFEDFSNWIKNEMISAGEFKLVSGTDITKYYNEEYYVEVKGTLGNSCMRYDECDRYFEVYEDNAKLLICEKNDKILGRAIVWELPEGTFMDRIYTCYDYLENQFIDFAQEHKWHYRYDNCLLHDGDYQKWRSPNDNYSSGHNYDLTIVLNKRYEYMPYVDSFRYYNDSENSLNTNPDKGDCSLSSTDGNYGESQETYVCACCGETERRYDGEYPEGWAYSEWEDCDLCQDCAHWCSGIHDYVSINTSTAMAHDEDGIELEYPELYLTDSSDFTLIEGKWFHKDNPSVVFDDKTNSYILVEQKDE